MNSTKREQIIIHTDGSCLGNPGRGGWAAVLTYKKLRKEASGGYRLTTNNRMEILAAVEALNMIKDPAIPIVLITDSQLLFNALSKGWLASWKHNGWRKSDKSPVLNRDLWERLEAALQGKKVEFRWTEAHVGTVENERCDELAKAAASAPDLKEDAEYVAAGTSAAGLFRK